MRTVIVVAATWFWCIALSPDAAHGAQLQPRTEAAFDRYARATEARMASEVARPDQFIWPLTRPPAERQTTMDALKNGALVIERLTSTDGGREIDVPDGLVHHWVGVAFLPGVALDRAVALLQDYNAHARSCARARRTPSCFTCASS